MQQTTKSFFLYRLQKRETELAEVTAQNKELVDWLDNSCTSPTLSKCRLQQKLAKASAEHKQLAEKLSEQEQQSEERIDELLEKTVVGVSNLWWVWLTWWVKNQSLPAVTALKSAERKVALLV